MNTTNAAAAVVLISAAMPFLVTFLKQAGWPKWANWLITVLACIAAGAVTVWAAGGFAGFLWKNLLIVTGAIFLGAQAAYAAYWKGTGIEATINERFSFIKVSTPVPVKKAAKKK